MKPTKQKNYTKLSVFGKYVLFGIALGIWLITNTLPSNISLSARIVGIVLLLMSIPCAFSDKVYCEYKYDGKKLNNIFSISGRLARSKYIWYFFVCGFLYYIVISIPRSSESDIYGMLLLSAPIQIALITASIRRSQDCGYNAWLPLIPVVPLILLFIPSDDKDNKYGPKSK